MDNFEEKLKKAMVSLSATRPIFHCERDFQHSLASEYVRIDPASTVRVEYPEPRIGTKRRRYVDLLIREARSTCFVELKHYTNSFTKRVDNEDFNLTAQSFQDVGKFHFLSDIKRIEEFVVHRHCTSGAVILLTNDSRYWANLAPGKCDQDFLLCEDRILHMGAKLKWSTHDSIAEKKNFAREIILKNDYNLSWRDYHDHQCKNGCFRYLLVQIPEKVSQFKKLKEVTTLP